ncbi:hypothetical protein ERN12_04460 [Rhodobacteraceae bacterium]|nr:hypothetical protein ERN12_04460 [Paracoccaceae bacterium]
MSDIHIEIAALRRPSLLVNAARIAQGHYRARRDLQRLVPAAPRLSGTDLLMHLVEQEAALDARRRDGRIGYSIARHIEYLVALMSEADKLPAPQNAPCDTEN